MQKEKLWNKDFVLMIQGNAVSSLGDILYSTAIGYWVYEKTGSNILLGLMSSIASLVAMFLSPFSGTIVDRVNRKAMVVGIDLVHGFLMTLTGILALSNKLTTSMVIVLALISALGSVFFSPCVSTILLDLIPHKYMVQGQSAFNSVCSLISLVGKAISGVLITLFGVGPIIIFNGISFFVSAISEMFINVPNSSQEGEEVNAKSVINGLKDGAKAIFKNKYIRLFVVSALLLNFLGSGSSGQMLPFILSKGYDVDFYGLLMAVNTAGSLLCGILLSMIKLEPKTRYYGMTIGFIGASIAYMIAYIITNQIIMMVLFFIGCMLNVLGNSIMNSCIMLALPNENRGSIIGFVSTFVQCGCAMSSIIYGLLCQRYNISLVFFFGTLMTIPLFIYLCSNTNTKEFIQNN